MFVVNDDLGTVQLRYKLPDHKKATEYSFPFKSDFIHKKFTEGSKKFQFISSVAQFAEILRGNEYAKGTLDDVLKIAQSSYDQGNEDETELIELVKKRIKYKGSSQQ